MWFVTKQHFLYLLTLHHKLVTTTNMLSAAINYFVSAILMTFKTRVYFIKLYTIICLFNNLLVFRIDCLKRLL